MSKRENRVILCHQQIKYRYITERKNVSRFFCQKEKALLPLFPQMLEGLRVEATVHSANIEDRPQRA